MLQYPISEIFGPTFQGEGSLIGTRTFFVRFAGCDYDCIWCDTKYAVNPRYEGWSRTMMSADEIVEKLVELGAMQGDWVTLSGGNPALFFDEELGIALQEVDLFISMETQGSNEMDALKVGRLDQLTISPKPPSSGMNARFDVLTVRKLVEHALKFEGMLVSLKYVFFDNDDLNWIASVDREIGFRGSVPRYLSVGTPLLTFTRSELPEFRNMMCDNLASSWQYLSTDVRFRDFVVLPQLHTLAYGQKRGV